MTTSIFFTKAKFYKIYNGFVQLLINKMHKLLTSIGYNIEYKTIKIINKFYRYCQIKSKAAILLKYILKKDINFNYKINIDIIYFDAKLIVHVIDTGIAFQAKQFLNNILAKKI